MLQKADRVDVDLRDHPLAAHLSAAVFFNSTDRTAVLPDQHLAGYIRILQADAYAGLQAGINHAGSLLGSRMALSVRPSRRLLAVDGGAWRHIAQVPDHDQCIVKWSFAVDVKRF
jgi:hypothetical protein